ncbi:hypothetical protein LX32DRAFT_719424, partial [Colletotrichum zoysiae]
MRLIRIAIIAAAAAVASGLRFGPVQERPQLEERQLQGRQLEGATGDEHDGAGCDDDTTATAPSSEDDINTAPSSASSSTNLNIDTATASSSEANIYIDTSASSSSAANVNIDTSAASPPADDIYITTASSSPSTHVDIDTAAAAAASSANNDSIKKPKPIPGPASNDTITVTGAVPVIFDNAEGPDHHSLTSGVPDPAAVVSFFGFNGNGLDHGGHRVTGHHHRLRSAPPVQHLIDPAKGAFIGGDPTTNVDVPVTFLFLLLFAAGAYTHIRIYRANAKRGHKFLLSDLMFDFCMVRSVTCIMRIIWAFEKDRVVILIALIVQFGG